VGRVAAWATAAAWRWASSWPGRNDRVVHIEGDGGFHFSTPTSVYAVAQAQGLPILTVVLDNGGWQAVKEAVLRVHPDGPAAQAGEFQARLKWRAAPV
jgi:acetolactate synthase I/II/III large subunit